MIRQVSRRTDLGSEAYEIPLVNVAVTTVLEPDTVVERAGLVNGDPTV